MHRADDFAVTDDALRFHSVTQSAHDAIIIADSKGIISSWNMGAHTMFGYAEDEVIGQSLTMLMPPQYREAHQTGVARLSSTGEARVMGKTVELEGLHKDGHSFPCELSLSTYTSSEGRCYGGIIRDISERKRAEVALRESEQFAHAIFDALPDEVAVLNDQGVIIAVNDAWRRFGDVNDLVNSNYMLGANYYNICERAHEAGDEQAQAVASGIRDVISGKRDEFDLEYPCHSPAERRWFALRVTRFARDGNVRALLAHRNVTVAKQSEQALRHSEERFRGAFQLTAVGMALSTLDGRYMQVNEALCRMLGYSAAELTGASVANVTHPDDHELEHALMSQLIEGNMPLYQREKRYIHKDGRLVWAMESIATVRGADGAPLHFVGQIQDITARKEAEFASQDTAKRLAAIVETQRDIAWTELDLNAVMTLITERTQALTRAAGAVVELVEGDEMVYRAVSGSAAANLGLRLDINTSLSGACVRSGELLICNDSETDERVDREACRRVNARSMIVVPLQHGQHTIGALKVLAPKDRAFSEQDVQTLQLMVGLLAAAMDHAQQFEAKQALIADRTAALDALEQSHHNVEMSNTELQQFAYVASHDLQEPLRTISSYLQLLNRRYRGKILDDDANEFIDYAVDGAKRMQALIQALLAYSRVGTTAIALEPTACTAVVETVLHNLQVAIDEKGARVHYTELPTVMGDPTLLNQLFQNLIGNSLKFCRDTEPEVHISAEQRDDEWVIAVKDNGIGIDPNYVERIFVIFQRLHTRTEYEGTGIGLAVCKKIVERHGGSIWVESQPGEGATFLFTLPVMDQKQSG